MQTSLRNALPNSDVAAASLDRIFRFRYDTRHRNALPDSDVEAVGFSISFGCRIIAGWPVYRACEQRRSKPPLD